MIALLAIGAALAGCGRWAAGGGVKSRLDAAEVDESSGLAWGGGETWFTLDDSGGPAALYAFRLDGTFLGRSEVVGATNVDWEDLAAGPCPGEPGGRCLFVADIGDNDHVREAVRVYAVPVPEPGLPTEVRAAWTLRYPEGARNAETFLWHAPGGRGWVVTKDKAGRSEVFRLPPEPGVGVLEKVADLDVRRFAGLSAGSSARLLTGGDWNEAGDCLVLRTYTAVWRWETDPAAPEAHWGSMPSVVPMGPLLKQAEAVAIGPDGRVVTTSEGSPMPIVVSGAP